MITISANGVTSRTVDLSWKHISKTKNEVNADTYYQVSKGEIASSKFDVVYEGDDTFCIVTDLKVSKFF